MIAISYGTSSSARSRWGPVGPRVKTIRRRSYRGPSIIIA